MTSELEKKAAEFQQKVYDDEFCPIAKCWAEFGYIEGAKALLEEARRWQTPAYGSGDMEVLISILEGFVGENK